MTKIQRTIASGLAASALILSTFSTTAFAATFEVSGNGSNSDSTVDFNSNQTTTVVQDNNADIKNDIDVDADTGGNDANDNTGGDVSIETGDADVEVNVSNTLNSNSANVDCCPNQDTDVLISGNGTYSDNDVKLNNNNDISVYQYNNAEIDNKVDADADTGDNDANDNTGGDVEVKTGDADVSVTISNTANANSAKVGGSGEDGANGSLSARILGNGSNSNNTIDLTLDDDVTLVQANNADILNDVYVDADTGDNDANDNTGGEVSIDTGDASADVTIDNWVNFNWADVDCGCILDVLAKISGNGTDSDNDIKAYLNNDQDIYQANSCGDEPKKEDLWLSDWNWGRKHGSDCDNKVDVDADTGDNDAKDNTGDVEGGDPSIVTGDADSTVEAGFSGNVNLFGVDGDQELPELDLNFNVGLSLGQLLALLGL